MFKKVIFTARKRSLGQGNVLTPVCHSVYQGGVHNWEGGAVWLGGISMAVGCEWLWRGSCVAGEGG